MAKFLKQSCWQMLRISWTIVYARSGCRKNQCSQITPGSIQMLSVSHKRCPGMFLSAPGWSMPTFMMNEKSWFSRCRISQDLSSRGPLLHSKWRFSTYFAVLTHIVEHGAKPSPPPLGPFGGPNGNLATLTKNNSKMTPLDAMSSMNDSWNVNVAA